MFDINEFINDKIIFKNLNKIILIIKINQNKAIIFSDNNIF